MSQVSATPLFDREMSDQVQVALDAQSAAAVRGDAGAAQAAAARLADLYDVLARHHGTALTAPTLG